MFLYQTLEDRDNPEEVEKFGPFLCRHSGAWLGSGYYFWDTFEDLAHWWGETCYDSQYIVCKAKCEFDTNKCLDLVGNTQHIKEFKNAIQLMKIKGLVNNNTSVARIIECWKNDFKVFDYEAVRVNALFTISDNNPVNKKYIDRIKFEKNKFQSLDLLPPIQICIYKKNGLSLSEYRIIYPDEYKDGDE